MDTHAVTHLAWSPDGKTLASANAGGKLRLWEVATRRKRLSLPSDGPLYWMPKSDALLAGNKLWDAETGNQKDTFVGESLALAPDGKTLAVDTGDGTVSLRDVRTGKEVRTLGEAREGVSSLVAWSPQSNLLDWKRGQREFPEGIHAVPFSPNSPAVPFLPNSP